MASDHSEQGNASQKHKRIRDIIKMKAAQHWILGKAILPGTSKAHTSTAFIKLHEAGTAKQEQD
jgi:hypothetical protein